MGTEDRDSFDLWLEQLLKVEEGIATYTVPGCVRRQIYCILAETESQRRDRTDAMNQYSRFLGFVMALSDFLLLKILKKMSNTQKPILTIISLR